MPPVAGFWSEAEAREHITLRELRAVRYYIDHYLEQLRGRRLLLHEDNQAVVAMIASLTSHSPLLMAELRFLVEALDLADVELRAIYIRSALNVIADCQSRLAASRDYELTRELFEEAQRFFGAGSLAAFASAATALLSRFWAGETTAEAEATDALAQDWRGERVWAHPPPFLML